MLLIKLHKISQKKIILKFKLFSTFFYLLKFFLHNSSLPNTVIIGENTKFAYGGIGLVIHSKAVIGKNCVIGQGITIGGRSKSENVPVIGDNVYLGAGCRILGDIKIGNDVIIGPNAVVLDSIPSNSIAVGVPAKVIKTGIDPKNYI